MANHPHQSGGLAFTMQDQLQHMQLLMKEVLQSLGHSQVELGHLANNLQDIGKLAGMTRAMLIGIVGLPKAFNFGMRYAMLGGQAGGGGGGSGGSGGTGSSGGGTGGYPGDAAVLQAQDEREDAKRKKKIETELLLQAVREANYKVIEDRRAAREKERADKETANQKMWEDRRQAAEARAEASQRRRLQWAKEYEEAVASLRIKAADDIIEKYRQAREVKYKEKEERDISSGKRPPKVTESDAIRRFRRNEKTIALDFETMGGVDEHGKLHAENATPISVGYADISGGKVGKPRHTYIKPKNIDELHEGHEDIVRAAGFLKTTPAKLLENLQNAPAFEDVQKELEQVLHQAVLVGHNALGFEKKVLKSSMGIDVPKEHIIDTQALEREAVGSGGKVGLNDMLMRVFGQLIHKKANKLAGLPTNYDREVEGHPAHLDALLTAAGLGEHLGVESLKKLHEQPADFKHTPPESATPSPAASTPSSAPPSSDANKARQTAELQKILSSTALSDHTKHNIKGITEAYIKSGGASEVENLAAQKLTADQIAKKLGLDREDVYHLRVGLGIPSSMITKGIGPGRTSEPNPEFDVWRKQFLEGQAASAHSPAPPAAPAVPTSPGHTPEEKAAPAPAPATSPAASYPYPPLIGHPYEEQPVHPMAAQMAQPDVAGGMSQAAEKLPKKLTRLQLLGKAVKELYRTWGSAPENGQDRLVTFFKSVGGALRGGGGGGGSSSSGAGGGYSFGGFFKELGKAQTKLQEWSAHLEGGSRAFLMLTTGMQGLIQAAAPDVWNTLTGSITLLAGQIGAALIPHVLELSATLQQWAQNVHDFSQANPAFMDAASSAAILAVKLTALATVVKLAMSALGSLSKWNLIITGALFAIYKIPDMLHWFDETIKEKTGRGILPDFDFDKWKDKANAEDKEVMEKPAINRIFTRNEKNPRQAYEELKEAAEDYGDMAKQRRKDFNEQKNTRGFRDDLVEQVAKAAPNDILSGKLYSPSRIGEANEVLAHEKRANMYKRAAEIAKNRMEGLPDANGAFVPSSKKLTDEGKSAKMQLLMSLQSFRAQPVYSGVEDLYKKTQITALGQDPLQQEIQKMRMEQMEKMITELQRGNQLSEEAMSIWRNMNTGRK